MMESNLINEQTATMKTQTFSANKKIGTEYFFNKKFHHIPCGKCKSTTTKKRVFERPARQYISLST